MTTRLIFMNYSKKLLIYIFSIIFILIISPNYVKADECDNNQCLTCEANIEECTIKFDIKNDEGGSMHLEHSVSRTDGSVVANQCSIEFDKSITTDKFISSDNKLYCPKIYYSNDELIPNGGAILYFHQPGQSIHKNEKEISLNKTSDNNKDLNIENACNYKFFSDKYDETVHLSIEYYGNDKDLGYFLDKGWELVNNYRYPVDLKPQDFANEECPDIYIALSKHNRSIYIGENKKDNYQHKDSQKYSGTRGKNPLTIDENGEYLYDPSKDDASDVEDIKEGNTFTCKDLKCTETYGYIKDIFFVVQIIVPILLLLFGSVDFLRAIIAQNDDDMKKAQSSFVKRLIVALNIVFGFLADIFNISTCGIGTTEEIEKCPDK